MITDKFTLKCTQRGGTKFKAASVSPGSNDPLTCAHCGTIIQLGAVKARVEQEARAAIADRLRPQLKPE